MICIQSRNYLSAKENHTRRNHETSVPNKPSQRLPSNPFANQFSSLFYKGVFSSVAADGLDRGTAVVGSGWMGD